MKNQLFTPVCCNLSQWLDCNSPIWNILLKKPSSERPPAPITSSVVSPAVSACGQWNSLFYFSISGLAGTCETVTHRRLHGLCRRNHLQFVRRQHGDDWARGLSSRDRVFVCCDAAAAATAAAATAVLLPLTSPVVIFTCSWSDLLLHSSADQSTKVRSPPKACLHPCCLFPF